MEERWSQIIGRLRCSPSHGRYQASLLACVRLDTVPVTIIRPIMNTSAIVPTSPPHSHWHLTEAEMSGLDNMQLVCSKRKPRHLAAIAAADATMTYADAQSRAEPAGGCSEKVAEDEGAEKGGEEGADNAEEGLQGVASTGLPQRHTR
jgi:hypothetical protein